MIRDTISKIEARLQGANACSDEVRAELLQLLTELKREISTVDEEQARSIAGHTEHVATQATAGESERNPEVLKRGLQELSESVQGFESSHPRLVAVVNRIATTLASIGI
jgi:Domain of unknown function (DUF4404)